MSWRTYRNIEASLYDFLTSQATADSLVDVHGDSVNFRVGRKNDNDWTLPTISFYFESETRERLEIGSNNRIDLQLIIIDIFAENEVDRLEFAKWVVDTINNGWTYYVYTGQSSGTPTKVASGLVNVNFLTNTRVALGENVSNFDAHRHRISIQTWISGS